MSLAKLVKVMQTYGAYEVFNQLSWISINRFIQFKLYRRFILKGNSYMPLKLQMDLSKWNFLITVTTREMAFWQIPIRVVKA